ncbi:hypothetical protein HBB16_05005 [Pseudonocardia sp. MCCB 268]|nr:hypothetical protein [Pseudonocardia cytotoxica]
MTSTRTDLLSCAGWYGLGGARCSVQPRRTRRPGVVDHLRPADRRTDAVTATERATDMIAAVSRGSGGGSGVLGRSGPSRAGALLHAAALGDKRMPDVLGWVADPDLAGRDVPALLRRSGVQAFEQDAMQFITTNDRTARRSPPR